LWFKFDYVFFSFNYDFLLFYIIKLIKNHNKLLLFFWNYYWLFNNYYFIIFIIFILVSTFVLLDNYFRKKRLNLYVKFKIILTNSLLFLKQNRRINFLGKIWYLLVYFWNFKKLDLNLQYINHYSSFIKDKDLKSKTLIFILGYFYFGNFYFPWDIFNYLYRFFSRIFYMFFILPFLTLYVFLVRFVFFYIECFELLGFIIYCLSFIAYQFKLSLIEPVRNFIGYCILWYTIN
jgi:hypothetical protein